MQVHTIYKDIFSINACELVAEVVVSEKRAARNLCRCRSNEMNTIKVTCKLNLKFTVPAHNGRHNLIYGHEYSCRKRKKNTSLKLDFKYHLFYYPPLDVCTYVAHISTGRRRGGGNKLTRVSQLFILSIVIILIQFLNASLCVFSATKYCWLAGRGRIITLCDQSNLYQQGKRTESEKQL